MFILTEYYSAPNMNIKSNAIVSIFTSFQSVQWASMWVADNNETNEHFISLYIYVAWNSMNSDRTKLAICLLKM